MGRGRPTALAFLLFVALCPASGADGGPREADEPMTWADLAALCALDPRPGGDDPPVREWIAWHQRAGFCDGVHAGVVSFALSPQHDPRLTGHPDEDGNVGFCDWFVLGGTELAYAPEFQRPYRSYLAEHPEFGEQDAVATLLDALPDIYPCGSLERPGAYALDLGELRALCTGEKARLALLDPASAQWEIAVLYASFGYCRGVVFGWIRANETTSAGGPAGASFCLPEWPQLAAIHIALVHVLEAQGSPDADGRPAAAELDRLLREALPCT